MPVSYWKGAVTNYKQRRSPHLMEHLEAFVGLRDKSGIPAIYNAAPSESFPILLRLVFDNDPNVREGVLPWLVSQNERMQLGDAALLRETVKVLREIDPRAVPMLLMLLKEESVSAEAAEALRQIDPEAAKRGGG